MSVRNGAVLFHAYEWDDYVARQAAALARRSGGLDFYVLADESRGELDTAPFRKLAHTQTHMALTGLPMRPADKALWWNLDYAVYDALNRLPQYDYLLRFDADVRVTVDLWDVVEHMRARDIDWLTLPLRDIAGWHFAPSLAAMPSGPRSFTPLMALMLSRRGARLLQLDRYRLARSMPPGGGPWPFCEGFVASAAQRLGLVLGGLDKVADTRLFKSEYGMIEDDERLRQPGHFFHAVLDARRLTAKLGRVVRHLRRTSAEDELRRLQETCSRASIQDAYSAALAACGG